MTKIILNRISINKEGIKKIGYRILLLLFLFSSAYGVNFQPMEQTLTPSGMTASANFQLVNSQEKDVAFEVSAVSREMSIEGEEVRKPTSHFTIFPKSGLVKPGETKSIRVSYKGPAKITSEAAYRVILKQIPLKEEVAVDNKAEIKYLMNFESSVYVAPEGVAPQIVVQSAKQEGEKLEVVLANKGTAHKILAKMEMMVELPEGKKLRVPRSILTPYDRYNVLAGSQLRLQLPALKVFKTVSNPQSLETLLKVHFSE